ncbi:hypothetical protein MPSEU_000557000 [Mayamaea pseudoterrestris]|nr:hypothetical protein MPSEU_000557000 [Mayamaea pseudoterrestris]
MSSPTQEEWKKIAALVDSFSKRPDTEPFRVPVPHAELGLTDYLKVIKTPMDLGTVKTKLRGKQYKTIFEVGHDVRLIWKNCMTYNQDGSDFHKLADVLSKKWDEKYNKLLGEMALSTSSDPTIAAAGKDVSGNSTTLIKDRQAFARSLYNITKEELGKVLVELEQKCPSSITRNAQEDEVELNVDKISAHLLMELQTFVSSCGQKAKKKKVATGATAKK